MQTALADSIGYTDATEEIMNATVVDSDQRTIAIKIGYGILGFIYAVVALQIPTLIVASVITSTGVADLFRPSILIQIAVGLSLSAIAYGTMSNRSLKSGMLVFYGMIIAPLFVVGAYSIVTSL